MSAVGQTNGRLQADTQSNGTSSSLRSGLSTVEAVLHKIEGTLGFYVAVTDSVLVEWLDSPPAQAEEISDPSETRENK